MNGVMSLAETWFERSGEWPISLTLLGGTIHPKVIDMFIACPHRWRSVYLDNVHADIITAIFSATSTLPQLYGISVEGNYDGIQAPVIALSDKPISAPALRSATLDLQAKSIFSLTWIPWNHLTECHLT